MSHQVDCLYLEAAVELASRGLYTTTPNPRVGCLIVKDGQIIGRGWHQYDGGVHAEVAALADTKVAARGATAYVSLEPCSFTGRTGACVQVLIDAGIQRVVIAQIDPNPEVSGKGLEALKAAGIESDLLELESARELNVGYYQRLITGRPWVRLKCAVSADGRTAMASGESRWITGSQARADVQYWRARSCAILTGIGTVLADDPELTVRAVEYQCEGKFRQPLRIILDHHLRTPAVAKIRNNSGGLRIYHTTAAVQVPAEADYVRVDGDAISLKTLLADLADIKINEVLVEAGPKLMGSFIQGDLWDELIVYSAPKIIGSAARPLALLNLENLAQAREMQVIDVRQIGADTRTIYRRIRKEQ